MLNAAGKINAFSLLKKKPRGTRLGRYWVQRQHHVTIPVKTKERGITIPAVE